MPEFDNRNRGVLFRDDRKTKESDRDFSGTIDIEGTEFWLSAWIKTSKKGTKFMSLSSRRLRRRRRSFNNSIGF